MKQENQTGSSKIISKYAVVNEKHGTMYITPKDERPVIYPFDDILLEDVEIEIRQDGGMHVIAKRVAFEYFYDDPEFLPLLESNKYVLKNSRVYKQQFLWWSFGKELYRSTWIELKERSWYEMVTSNYCIRKVGED